MQIEGVPEDDGEVDMDFTVLWREWRQTWQGKYYLSIISVGCT